MVVFGNTVIVLYLLFPKVPAFWELDIPSQTGVPEVQ